MTPALQQARLAAIFLTRLPLRLAQAPAADGLAEAMRLFPLIGGAIGLGVGLLFGLAHLWLASWPAALLAVTGGILLTGALHEDGLADCADGFGGGRDRDHRLAIMRDSAIGSYGALALILSVGLRAAALVQLDGFARTLPALIAAHALARAALPVVMHRLPAASDSGMAAAVGRPARPVALIAAILAAAMTALLLPGRVAIGALLAVAAVTALMAALARRLIGGHSGDVLGAVEQLAEIAALLAIAASWSARP